MSTPIFVLSLLVILFALVAYAMMCQRDDARQERDNFKQGFSHLTTCRGAEHARFCASGEDGERLARLVRRHVVEMDAIADKLGGLDSKLMLNDEREALRLHDELNENHKPYLPCHPNSASAPSPTACSSTTPKA